MKMRRRRGSGAGLAILVLVLTTCTDVGSVSGQFDCAYQVDGQWVNVDAACREAASPCDVPEVCEAPSNETGVPFCPTDRFREAGTYSMMSDGMDSMLVSKVTDSVAARNRMLIEPVTVIVVTWCLVTLCVGAVAGYAGYKIVKKHQQRIEEAQQQRRLQEAGWDPAADEKHAAITLLECSGISPLPATLNHSNSTAVQRRRLQDSCSTQPDCPSGATCTYYVEEENQGCCDPGACNDPQIVPYNGASFFFSGINNHTYALLSEDRHQVNIHLKHPPAAAQVDEPLWITAVGLRIGAAFNLTVEMLLDWTTPLPRVADPKAPDVQRIVLPAPIQHLTRVVLNGEDVSQLVCPQDSTELEVAGSDVRVNFTKCVEPYSLYQHTVLLTVSSTDMQVVIQAETGMKAMGRVHANSPHLDVAVHMLQPANLHRMHGILGQTAYWTDTDGARKHRGRDADYDVGSDLLGTQFAYATFNGSGYMMPTRGRKLHMNDATRQAQVGGWHTAVAA
jgi:hypothetical protein